MSRDTQEEVVRDDHAFRQRRLAENEDSMGIPLDDVVDEAHAVARLDVDRNAGRESRSRDSCDRS